LFNKVPNVQVSDTTGEGERTKVEIQIFF